VGEDLCSDSDSSDPDPVMRLSFLFEESCSSDPDPVMRLSFLFEEAESCSPCDKILRGY
jgi:hypothetical protein